MISVPMHMRMFALIRIRVHFVAVFTLYGAASTDLLGVLSVRRAKRRFSSMVGRGGGVGVLVVFPVIMGLGCIISSVSMSRVFRGPFHYMSYSLRCQTCYDYNVHLYLSGHI